MTPSIGFVILSHENPLQLRRLISRINELFGDPPIACHHDFSQCPLEQEKFPSNVKFVLPHLKTGWAKWSLVEASLRALALLYKDSPPDWFVLLSGADYPIKSGGEVLHDLTSGGADAYLDYRPATRSAIPTQDHLPCNPRLGHYANPGNIALTWRWYVGAQIWLPILRVKKQKFSTTRHLGVRPGRFTMYLPFTSPWSPFNAEFRCYYGSQWFTGNKRVADILLNPTKIHMQLRSHLRRRAVPDECYVQTVLRNEQELRICKDTKRFVEWRGGGAHPQILALEDLPRMLASGAHFARKFAPDSPVLDDIDRILSGSQVRCGEQSPRTDRPPLSGPE